MKPIRFIPAAVLLLAAVPAAAQAPLLQEKFSDWNAVAQMEGEAKVCFIASEPTKAEGKYKSRGDTWVLVTHRPAENARDVVSVKAGYTYQKGKEVEVKIGAKAFKLFTDADHAWAYDGEADKALVKAMFKGIKMVIKGTSSRGTLTTDTYSLKGFTAAYKAAAKACGL